MIQTDNTTLAVAQALITLRDENKALKADNERLKKALGDIATGGCPCSPYEAFFLLMSQKT